MELFHKIFSPPSTLQGIQVQVGCHFIQIKPGPLGQFQNLDQNLGTGDSFNRNTLYVCVVAILYLHKALKNNQVHSQVVVGVRTQPGLGPPQLSCQLVARICLP